MYGIDEGFRQVEGAKDLKKLDVVDSVKGLPYIQECNEEVLVTVTGVVSQEKEQEPLKVGVAAGEETPLLDRESKPGVSEMGPDLGIQHFEEKPSEGGEQRDGAVESRVR